MIAVNLRPRGFTLIEIMLVVGILSLLAAIAIPNLLRSRISANDTMARTTLRAIATAAEAYATSNTGSYPIAETDLTAADPIYLNRSYCSTTVAGFTFNCTFVNNSYTITAVPVALGASGSGTFTIRTGGLLLP